jgi:hypothetical protein
MVSLSDPHVCRKFTTSVPFYLSLASLKKN